MKKIIYIIICLLVVCACNNSRPQEDPKAPKDDTTLTTKKDSNNSVEGRKLPGTLEVDVTNLKTDVNNIKAQLSSDSTNVEKLSKAVGKKVDGSIVYFVIGGFAILLILIVLLFSQILKLRSQIEKDKQDLKTPPIKGQKKQQVAVSTNVSPAYAKQRDIIELRQQIEALSNKVKTLGATPTPPVAPAKAKEEKKRPIGAKNVYFGKNRGDIFPDELSPSNELVVFKGEFESPNKVKFQPISLDRIKSLNGLEDVLIIRGNVQKAKTMKVETFGKAVKHDADQNYWKVESKAIIRVN